MSTAIKEHSRDMARSSGDGGKTDDRHAREDMIRDIELLVMQATQRAQDANSEKYQRMFKETVDSLRVTLHDALCVGESG